MPDRDHLPLVLVVSPYTVFPPSHGGAVRIHHLLRELTRTHRIVLLSDEENAYGDESVAYFAPFEAVHLVGGRREAKDELGRRAPRIASHSHPLLARELARLVRVYRPALVQVEYMELGGLVEYGKHGLPWVLSLHDVLLTEQRSRWTAEDDREAALIARHDAVVVCSPEDAALLDHPRVTVVHNGAPTEGRTRASSAGSKELLFMGPFRYPPNFEGIRRFLVHAYPEIVERVPDVTLTLLAGAGGQAAARDYPCFRQRGVRIEETISDPAPYLERCAMTLNPQHAIRGSSIKLIESLSAGRMCVSTLEGARGHRNAGLSSLVTVERIEDFAAPVTFYLVNQDARLALERAPESRLAERGWPRAAEILRGVYDAEIHAP